MLQTFFLSIFILLAGIGGVFGLGFGLMRAVNFIEDRSYAAKKRIDIIIKVISGLHLLILIRGISKFVILFSLLVQFLFYSLLDDYPGFSPTAPYFICGTVGALINHFFFLRELVINNLNVVETLVYFFVFVWTTPFCFFLSLSANDESFATRNKRRETFIGKVFKKMYNPLNKQNMNK